MGRRVLNKRIYFICVSIAVLLADQLSKLWAATRLNGPYGPLREVKIIGNFFSLAYTQNSGIALGLFGDSGASTKWLLVAVSIGAAIFVVTYMVRVSQSATVLMSALSLLLAGILGNLLDRFFHGYVIDFISFQYNGWQFPVFNLADTAITVGAVLMGIDLIFGSGRVRESDEIPPVTEARVNLDENA